MASDSEFTSRPVVYADPDAIAPTPARLARSPLSGAALDWIERAIAVALFSFFFVRFLDHFRETGNPGDLLILALELMVVLFILIRRPAVEVSLRPRDWLLALIATCLPWCVVPASVGTIGPQILGCSLLIVGLTTQGIAKIVLNRNFGLVAARRELVMAGPYRLVRHPIYASYFIGHSGFLLLNPTLWNLGVYTACTSVQIVRLMAEERLLSHDPAYRAYQNKVRYRLIPGVF